MITLFDNIDHNLIHAVSLLKKMYNDQLLQNI